MDASAIFGSNALTSVSAFVINVIVAILIYIIGKKLIKLLLVMLDAMSIKAGLDVTLSTFLKSFCRIALYVIMIFLIINQLGFNTASVITLLGSAALAVGLSLQGSLANFAGGVLILVTRPFKVGDYVVCSGGEGTVTEIGIVYTRLETLDRRIITIPNGTLSNDSVVNCTNDTRRVDITLPISCDSDIKAAKELLIRAFNADDAVLKDQDHPVAAVVSDLNDGTVTLCANGYVNGADYWPVKWRLTENIKLALDEAGISTAAKKFDVRLDK